LPVSRLHGIEQPRSCRCPQRDGGWRRLQYTRVVWPIRSRSPATRGSVSARVKSLRCVLLGEGEGRFPTLGSIGSALRSSRRKSSKQRGGRSIVQGKVRRGIKGRASTFHVKRRREQSEMRVGLSFHVKRRECPPINVGPGVSRETPAGTESKMHGRLHRRGGPPWRRESDEPEGYIH
jgi:hypothetical protein